METNTERPTAANKIHTCVTSTTRRRLAAVAAAREVPVAVIVRFAISEWLAKHDQEAIA